MFIPMNVEGGIWEENFMTTSKIVTLGILVAADIISVIWVFENLASVVKIAAIAVILLVSQYVLRKVIFEENYYYKMYKKMKEYSVSKPSIFWDIASVKEIDEQAVLIYSDMKAGVIIKVDRDTITGRTDDFREVHYDALSNFYKELNIRKLKFVQLNIMEQAGKDPRLQTLDKLALSTENKNLSKIIELQVGYIKNITRATLFESDYFLIYTEDRSKIDNILTDAVDCIYRLIEGSYIDYDVLSLKDIIELVKEIYDVKYFDYTDAMLNMYKKFGVGVGSVLGIEEIHFKNGEIKELGNAEINKLIKVASYNSKNGNEIVNISIKEALNGKMGVSTEDISNEIEQYDYMSEADESLDDNAFGVNQNKFEGSISKRQNIKKEDKSLEGTSSKNKTNQWDTNYSEQRYNIQHVEDIITNEDKELINEDEIIDY